MSKLENSLAFRISSHVCMTTDACMVMEQLMRAIPTDLGRELAALRIGADRKQSEVAAAMRVHASAVSRIETGTAPLDEETLNDYLDAINTDSARRFREVLQREWSEIPRPPVNHPNLESLLNATDCVKRVDEFLADPTVPRPLEGQARLLRAEILRSAGYLADLRHSVAYIGDIGVGKTTAACYQAGLTRQTKPVRDLKEDVLLATGAGRTTVCEVKIRTGDRFALIIEPVPDDEVYRLVAEFAADLWDRREGKLPSNEESRALSAELDRALRNMAGIRRRREKGDNGTVVIRDEGLEIAKEVETPEDLRSAIAERLRLYKRTVRELVPEVTDEASAKAWLRDTFYKVNDGRHDAVTLPNRITVVVPFRVVSDSPWLIDLIDTKGIDQTSIRPDLKAVIDDPRCVSIFCCGFRDAPGQSVNILFEHLKVMGSLRAIEQRTLLLVLDRAGEAHAMRDDATGADVESVEEGRELKKLQIRDAFARIGVGNLPISFFNTAEDDPKYLNQWIATHLQQIREHYVAQLMFLRNAVESMIKNRKQEYALAAQQEVNRRIEIFVEQHPDLPDLVRHCQDSLLDQLSKTHVRTVWASMRRSGSWPNFDVFFWLGVGAAQDAKLRTQESVSALLGLIENMLGDSNLQPAHDFLRTLKSSVEAWNAGFLDDIRNLAAEVFRPALDDDWEFWTACENEWGQGSGYRDRVHDRVRDWFENQGRLHLHRTLDQRMRRAWKTEFVDPLRKAISITMLPNDEMAVVQ